MSFQKVSFLDVFKDASGGNIKTPKNEFLDEGSIPVVDQGQQLVAGYVNDKEKVCKASPPVIVFGDHTRAIKYVDFEFAMGADGIKVLVPKIEADPKFLFYALRSINLPSAGYSRHYKFLKEAEIPLPSLAEQKRIAEILDTVDALRVKRRKALAHLDTFLESTFIDMFGDPETNPMGWEKSALGNVCNEKPAYGSGAAACEFRPSLPRYVRITDVDNSGELSGEPKSANLSASELEKYRLKEGDILFARSGATVGKTYLHRERNGLFVYAGYMIRFRPDSDRLLPEVLFRYTQTFAYRRWVKTQARVVAQPNINAKTYSSLPVILPPIKLQSRFATIVEAVEKQKARMRAHLAELDALFASLQHRAFNGEL